MVSQIKGTILKSYMIQIQSISCIILINYENTGNIHLEKIFSKFIETILCIF